ncbi:nucleoside transporter C-terminal domain-containing protein [Leptolyngbya sp. FACHB-16]|uniref:NupC/NupG family nucleoside CNT transporter n=1 Tax=unclassified Leptolyngbya TaxID=2650499 RepID=UPI0016896F6D|nr:nucleoside transporter C-terminal domain-containing protein [Leptolyngbya sp. FACHB-16]MBD2155924.1 NupC/NupG family nucleoside CNT transporter [Leptolyngbya sp. FACHB-16]
MERFISLIGILVFFGLAYLLSVDRRAIQWRTVVWGFALQFLFGVFVLRTGVGFHLFNGIGNLVTAFLNFSDAGAEFVFGENFRDIFFAFKVMPTVIFFSAFISLLYYYGILQRLVSGIAWVMQRTMKTSGPETTSCAANIFVGQTEAPLLIKPFINHLTESELHAVMVGGFATVAGSVLAAFIGFGLSAQALISATVMNAPGALAISKIVYPELERSRYRSNRKERSAVLPVNRREHTKSLGDEIAGPNPGAPAATMARYPNDDVGRDIDPDANTENVIEERLQEDEEIKSEQSIDNPIAAIADGAIQGMKLVLNIIAILIAFLALIAFLNAILGWLGGLVGFPQLSLEWLLSLLLAPLAFLMGVPWQDAGQVGVLLGKRTIINEFVAYVDLRGMVEARAISERSILIATFALCGFANISSIGQQIGGIGGIAPKRIPDLAKLGFRAMLTGTLCNFITAAIAGLLL